MNEWCNSSPHEEFPGPKPSSEDRPSDPGRAHLTPRPIAQTRPVLSQYGWLRSSREYLHWQFAHSGTMSNSRHAIHSMPSLRYTFPKTWPRTRKSLLYLGTYQVLATCHTGVSGALGMRVYYGQTPSGVHQAFQNAHGPQNTAPNRHPVRQGITIRIEATSTRVLIKVEKFGPTELCRITALWHWCIYLVFRVSRVAYDNEMLNLINGQHRLGRKGPKRAERGIRNQVMNASVITGVANGSRRLNKNRA